MCSVALTKSPVIFIGTGEHMDGFEVFEVKMFVSRLLGMNDWSEFMDKTYEVPQLPDNPPERENRCRSRAFYDCLNRSKDSQV